jgi:DNA-binding MarR family transcriptional regulator
MAGASHPLQSLLELDRIVHEPARLLILTILSGAEAVEFRYLESVSGLSKGNISSHVAKLQQAGFLEVTKSFRGRIPATSYRLTEPGRTALANYWTSIRAAIPAGPKA